MNIKYQMVAFALSAMVWTAGCAGAPVQDSVVEVERGAQVWRATCARCHNLRPPTEFTEGQWVVIVNHMRTRQDLTKSDAEAVAAFLAERTSATASVR